MGRWRELVAVAIGGVIGTGLRLGLDTLVPHEDAGFPTSTLIINVVGAFALGFAVSALWERPGFPAWLKAGSGAGLIGSFTTFSAVIVSLVAQAAAGEPLLALAYLVATLLLGFGAAVGGLAIGRRRRSEPDLVDE